MSNKTYEELDCSRFRYKTLKFLSYTQPMGKGEIQTEFSPSDEWDYPLGMSIDYVIQDFVCKYVN
jgi:hypothetical protein